MKIEDLAPVLEAWDALNGAINGFVVAMPPVITDRAARLGKARAEMTRHYLPASVQRAWTALQQTIGTALVSAPHEMSASIERLELRRDAMREAVWGLSKLITQEQEETVTNLGAVMADRHPKRVSRLSRR